MSRNVVCKTCKIVDPDTRLCTVNDHGEHHSFNDKPAMIYKGELKIWFLDGEVHRENAPAKMWPDGDKEWYWNGKIHREDGPACDYAKHKRWYLNGKEALKIGGEELYVGKSFKYNEGIAIVFEKINEFFYRVVVGDEKFLVVYLDKYREA